MRTYECPSGDVVLLDEDVVLPGRLSIGSHGYPQLTGVEAGTVVLLHRWLTGCTKGDGTYVDHLNRVPLDCRRANLRVTTASGNNQNRATPSGNAYKSRRSNRWYATVKFSGTQHYLGTYDTNSEARAVAAEWRRLNMPLMPV